MTEAVLSLVLRSLAIALVIAAILDPFGNAVHTALSFDLVGEDVLVTGAGTIGCLTVMAARLAGAASITVST